MPEKCGKCDTDIAKLKELLKCVECRVNFHPECNHSVSTEGVNTRKTWKCDGCFLGNTSTGMSKDKHQEPGHASVLDAIAAFRQESKHQWDEFSLKLNKVQTDIDTMKSDLGHMKTQVNKLEVESMKTTDEVEKLKNENQMLNDKLQAMTIDVCDLQQYTRINNMLITGVPITKGENIYMVLDHLAQVLNIKMYRSEISVAHRLSSRQGDPRPPSIVVSFVSRCAKTEWMNARRRRGTLTANELHDSFPDQPIYLNEQLTPQTRALFNKARDLLKSKKLAYVWTSDCKVLVKQTERSATRRVQREEDLLQFSNPDSSPTPQHSNKS